MSEALIPLMLALPLAQAKLPPPSPEAQASAAQAKLKAAWSDKVAAYQLCLALGFRGQYAGAADQGALASFTQSYKEQYVEEDQTFYRSGTEGLSEFSDYDFRIASRRSNVGGVANVSYQFTPVQRLSVENFYTHSGRDEAVNF